LDAEAAEEEQAVGARVEWEAIGLAQAPAGIASVRAAGIGCRTRQASPATSGSAPNAERPCSANDDEARTVTRHNADKQAAAAQGTLVAVCVSAERTEPKVDVGSGELRAGYGLVGDSHAGLSEREVSLLAYESILRVRDELGIDAYPGCFAENLVVQGLDFSQVEVGNTIQVGDAALQVVQLGKPPDVPHTYSFHGVSILPTEGVFCRIVRTGRVSRGDAVIHVRHAPTAS